MLICRGRLEVPAQRLKVRRGDESDTISIEHLRAPGDHLVRGQIARLNELRALAPGWVEGGGGAPPGEGLDWLAKAFQRRFPDDLALPHLYPTEEGGIQAEWQSGPVDISLDIDLRAHTAQWHVLDMQTNQVETRELNLNADEDWRWLAIAIKRLAGGAA